MLNQESLAVTVDAVNDALFRGTVIKSGESNQICKWIASRQGMKRSYAGMFAPTDKDFKDGIRLFTGERMTSGAGTSHILGEEACRILILLNSKDKQVKESLQRATSGMTKVLKNHKSQGYTVGMYCCGTCTTALWRHLAAGGLYDQEHLLKGGAQALKLCRDDKGRWRRFPMWHTALALSEMDVGIARSEMEYIAPAIEKSVRYLRKDNKYTSRRKQIAENLLGKI